MTREAGVGGPAVSAAAPSGGADCRCQSPPFDFRDFASAPVGTDPAGGRFADVSVETCRACGRRWLHYAFELEAVPRSGRWYRGPLPGGAAVPPTPGEAVGVLAALPWHFFGGSHYGTAGRWRDGPVALDPHAARS